MLRILANRRPGHFLGTVLERADCLNLHYRVSITDTVRSHGPPDSVR